MLISLKWTFDCTCIALLDTSFLQLDTGPLFVLPVTSTTRFSFFTRVVLPRVFSCKKALKHCWWIYNSSSVGNLISKWEIMGKIVKDRRREDDRASSKRMPDHHQPPPPPALFISSKLRQNFHHQLFWSRILAFRNFCKLLSVSLLNACCMFPKKVHFAENKSSCIWCVLIWF